MPVLVLMLASVSCAIDDVVCDADANGITLPKGYVTAHFNHLDLRNAVMSFIHHQHHLMPVLELKPSHDQKCHVVLHFDNLDLRNAIVPLMMPFGII